MSFRHKAKPEQARAWKRWLRENQQTLERIGLPLSVYKDAEHWDDFLEMGELDRFSDGPPFGFAELSCGQLDQLRALLERSYPESPPRLLGFIRARLGTEDG